MRIMSPQKQNETSQNNSFTLDWIIKEALITGIDYDAIGNFTWGELLDVVEAYSERTRREAQTQAIIAFRQTWLHNNWLAGKNTDIDIMEVFPFWTEDEKKEAMIEKYKTIMYKPAARKVVKGGEN